MLGISTGAASGIGRATALMLAQQGCRLALTDRNTEGGRSVCEEIRALGKVDVVFATLDITSRPMHPPRLPQSLTHSLTPPIHPSRSARRRCRRGKAGAHIPQDVQEDRRPRQLRR